MVLKQTKSNNERAERFRVKWVRHEKHHKHRETIFITIKSNLLVFHILHLGWFIQIVDNIGSNEQFPAGLQ